MNGVEAVNDQELEALRDPRHWDHEHVEVLEPVKHPRAVVSVSFPREDFEQVTQAARERGMKTSEFIRKAALEHEEHSEMPAWHGAGIQMAIPVSLAEHGGIELPTPVGPSGRPLRIGSIRVSSKGAEQMLIIELEPEQSAVEPIADAS